MLKYFKKLYLVVWLILLVTCDSLIVEDNYRLEDRLTRALSQIEFNTYYIDTELLYLQEETGGYPVDWSSSHSSILNSQGVVNRPSISQGRREVLLTATSKYNGIECSRDFTFFILPQGKSVEYLKVGSSLVKFTLETVNGDSYYSSDTFPIEGIKLNEVDDQIRTLSLNTGRDVDVNYDSDSGFRYIVSN